MYLSLQYYLPTQTPSLGSPSCGFVIVGFWVLRKFGDQGDTLKSPTSLAFLFNTGCLPVAKSLAKEWTSFWVQCAGRLSWWGGFIPQL
jgi:hypothetical protein